MATEPRQSSAFGVQTAFPRLDVNRKDPVVDSVMSKMVSDSSSPHSVVRRNRAMTPPDMALLQKISDMTSNNITASASLLQMLPDTELAMQILVSSILSPKDMVSTELNYTVEPGQFNSELAGPLLECLRTYFEGTYKMGDLLPKMLQDALFYTGSYALLVLPENTIDEAINSPSRVSMETIRSEIDSANGRMRPVGILGNPSTEEKVGKDFMGLESLSLSAEAYNRGRTEYNPEVATKAGGSFDLKLSVHDNPNTLKMPMLQDKMRQDRLHDILSVRKLSMESSRTAHFNRAGKPEEASLYKRRRYKLQPVLAMAPQATLKKRTLGHPLVMRLPSECVIPVHVPSNPEEHLGYFILLDEQGNPLVRATESDYYSNMGANLNNNDVANQLIQKSRVHTAGREDPLNQHRQDVTEMTRIYSDLVETELNQRLRSGVYGDNVQVAKPEEIYRIMFARALANMRTQALYVPIEMMTYVAFDYNQHGVGESLIQKSKIIGGLRVMLSFANTMAAIKNSIGRTKMAISLDPADDDPTQTVEFLVHEHSKLRQGAFPLGNSNPSDIINYFQNAAVELEVSGNTSYPETKVLMEDIQSGRIKPDAELEEMLKKRHLMALGLSPETVDAGANAEFATTIMANNLLLTKRVLMYQRAFVIFLEDFIQKYTLSSGWLMEEMRKIIEENRSKLNADDKRTMDGANEQADDNAEQKPDAVVEERPLEQSAEYGRKEDKDEDEDTLGIDGLIMQFIQAVRVSLPTPDTSTLDNQMKAYDSYVEALDKVLAAYLDSGFLATTELGELEEFIEPTIKAVRAYYLRQWLRNNNVMPELDELTSFNDDESPALDLLEAHGSHVEGIGKSLLTYLKAIAATRKKLDPKTAELKQDLSGGADLGGDDAGIGGDDLGGSDLGGDGAEVDDLSGGDDAANADADANADGSGNDLPDLDIEENAGSEGGAGSDESGDAPDAGKAEEVKKDEEEENADDVV